MTRIPGCGSCGKRGLLSAAFMVLLAVGLGGCSGDDQQDVFVFDSSQEVAAWRIPVETMGLSAPADWSGLEALVFEFRTSSSQRMNLKIVTEGPDGEQFSRVLFHPYPGPWVRAAVPLSLLAEPPSEGHDMASVGNRSRVGYFLSLWGPFVPLDRVKAVVFEMESPIGSPTLEIRSIEVVGESPGDAILEGAPVVDQFGQAVHADWPDKAGSLEELRAAWEAEEASLEPGQLDYGTYGGYASTSAEATGFFRVEQIDGRWWFVDPEGHLFLSIGSDVIQPSMATPVEGRESLFAVLPPDFPDDGRRHGASFFTWNLQRRFGEDWMAPWISFTIRRMDAWGLNTVANWSSQWLWDSASKPYVIPLASWLTDVNYLGLPDVYSPEFEAAADIRAREQCEPRRDDPWLIGYFLANEPPFPQKQLQTADMVLSGPDTATRRELERWLAEEDTPERRQEFIDEAFDRYVQITSDAVRRHDPNHLILGMRSGGRPTDAEIAAARAFDVYSVNIYNYEVQEDRVRRISELTGKPIIIGEFHFGTPERGLAASLVQVRDQAERGTAYRYYVEQAFAMPEMIGTHWFQWADQPCTGRFDGENYNIGLVDVTDRPYPDMIEALKETHRRLYDVHRGAVEPFSTQARPN